MSEPRLGWVELPPATAGPKRRRSRDDAAGRDRGAGLDTPVATQDGAPRVPGTSRTGGPKRPATAGVRALGRALGEHEVEDIGDGLLLPAGMREAFEAVKKPHKRSVDLL